MPYVVITGFCACFLFANIVVEHIYEKILFYVFINSEELSFKVKLDLRNWFSTESKQSITDERKKIFCKIEKVRV